MKKYSKTIFILVSFILTTLLICLFESKSTLVLDRYHYIKSHSTNMKALIYIFTFLLNTLSIALVIISKSKRLRRIFFFIITPLTLLEISYLKINQIGFNVEEARRAIDEASYALTAFINFSYQIGFAFILTCLLIISLIYLGRYLRTKVIINDRITVIAILFSFIFTYSIIFKTSGSIDEFPASHKVTSIIGISFFGSNWQLYYPTKEEVKLNHDKVNAKHILYIIDESIRADELSLNKPVSKNKSFLQLNSKSFINLGEANSTANCSAEANLLLRTGTKPSELPDKKFYSIKRPTLYQFAKKAGYDTFYLDAQKSGGELQNYLGPHDLKYINKYIQNTNKDIVKHNIDLSLINEIKKILETSKSSFIIFNKIGAHFVYDDMYPETETIFRPTMRGKPIGLSSIEEVKNSYKNAVRYSTDVFFKNMMPLLDKHNVELIYTSDHGITYSNSGQDHCALINKTPEQGLVPIVLKGKILFSKFTNKNLLDLKNNSSSFQIFSSLLVLMGYKETDLNQTYEPPLWKSSTQDRFFVSGEIFGRGKFNKNYINSEHLE